MLAWALFFDMVRKRKPDLPQLRTTPCHLLDVLYTLHCSFWKEKEREAADAQKKAEDEWGVVRLTACDCLRFAFLISFPSALQRTKRKPDLQPRPALYPLHLCRLSIFL